MLSDEDLLAWLRDRGAPHADALADAGAVGAAVAGEWAGPRDSLFGAVEVALFPPRGVL